MWRAFEMKTLIVTVAGTATRFNRDTQEPTLKCLYNVGGFRNTLLYQILDKARDFDEYVIVGGYLFEKLRAFVDNELLEFNSRIKLVYNPEYYTFGSGYSLILGINNSDSETDEIVFVEGDLYYDGEDFKRIKDSRQDVFTVCHELITARKAVVVYEDIDGKLHYLYDTAHSYLEIKEPFLAVYNSGQIWKFIDAERLREILKNLSPKQIMGTNLEIIQSYFGNLSQEQYEMVELNTWFNCNTVADYDTVHSIITR